MNPQKTTIDWLRFRTQSSAPEALEGLRPLYGSLGTALSIEGLPRAVHGFQMACAIKLGDVPVGRMDFGGGSQRGWLRVDVPGKGCGWISDWERLDSVERLDSAEIKRLDVALTTWNGEITHDRVVAAHAAGGFTTRGRPPDLGQRLNSNPKAGRTCEVGKRKDSDKYGRFYEKGFELASKLGTRGRCVETIDGFRVEDIYRCEVEFKAINSDIPWEVVERRDEYFAGAYPFCAEILPDVACDILQRRPQRQPQIDLMAALENIRIQAGPTLFTALHAYHGDLTAVWDRVVGEKHNQALVEAGVLLADH